jgi:SAM-dependent methyltransferase
MAEDWKREKIAKLGKPSLVFGPGQQRRLELVKEFVPLANKRVLDVGCGLGVYSGKFSQERATVWGIDPDPERVSQAKRSFPEVNFLVGESESLPFEENFFDLVFLNEVLEHVKDDRQTLQECFRILKPGGKAVVFVPNRGHPFETHGIYLGQRYVYRLIPLINWLPDRIRDFFCPHVRVYSVKSFKKLFQGLNVSFQELSFVWPAFDKLSSRHARLGHALQKVGAWAEKNHFLKKLGISIFAVVEKV